MNLKLRPGMATDASTCGPICYEAFRTVSAQHNFPPDIPSPETAIGLFSMLLGNPGFYSVVAELDGKVVGSNFLDERSTIAGVGPITIDPQTQNRGIGRKLMEDVLNRAQERAFPGVRLVQAAYQGRSLSLYTSLGFDAREPLVTMQGPPPRKRISGWTVRTASEEDLDACNQLCRNVHGHDRAGEVADAVGQGVATVVEHGGRITGYSTGIAFFSHSVAATNDDLKALISAAAEFGGPGFLLPMRNGELFRWCLANGLRVVQPLTLMSMGLYNEPSGAFLPSILY